MHLEVVVKNAVSELGEGPHWDDASQSLLFVDILTKELFRWDLQTGKVDTAQFDKTIGFVVPCKKGGYMLGLGQTLSHYDWDSGKLTVVKEVDQDKTTRFNDGKCDPAGRVWAGTMGLETAPAQLQLNQGTLYSLDTDGALKSHKDKVSISNGLAWTADNRTMFYIDSITRNVVAYDYDLSTGTLSSERTVVQYGDKDTIKSLGFPDGMTIDTEDKIWVACFGPGKVIRWDPQTGKELQTINLPTSNITSCCFGGKDLDELYITTSRYGLNEEQKQQQPLAGSVFKVTGLGVKGRPANVYEG